jgi:hypothetical protein
MPAWVVIHRVTAKPGPGEGQSHARMDRHPPRDREAGTEALVEITPQSFS